MKYFTEYLDYEIENRIKQIFIKKHKKEADGSRSITLEKRFIVNYIKECSNTAEKETFNELIKDCFNIFESSSLPKTELCFYQNALNYTMLEELSKTYSSVNLKEHILNQLDDNEYVKDDTVVIVSKDYLDDKTYHDKSIYSKEYIKRKYGNQINVHFSKRENRRHKKCFLAISLEKGCKDFHLSKTKSAMYERLNDENVLSKMDSFQNYDFSKKSIFNKYFNECSNYLIVEYKQ